MIRTTTRAPRGGWHLGWAGAALIAAALAAPSAQAADADTVVARVGETEITLGHVVGLMARLPQQYRQLPDEVLLSGIVEQLVEQTAVVQAASEPFNTRLRIDLDNSARELIVNDALGRVIDEAVDDDALRALYAQMYLDAEPEREFSAAHILVETREEAEALLQELEEGAEFAHLAREHSRDPGSAEGGGALGWFRPGQMVAPFDAAVQALEPGETSEPVETRFGWHLIQLEGRRLAEAPSMEAVRDELVAELQRAAVAEHVAAARGAVPVEVMLEGIDPAIVRDQSILQD
ncbi:MAG: peptidylprolyl isomerase [Alkalilacustris sp.]